MQYMRSSQCRHAHATGRKERGVRTKTSSRLHIPRGPLRTRAMARRLCSGLHSTSTQTREPFRLWRAASTPWNRPSRTARGWGVQRRTTPRGTSERRRRWGRLPPCLLESSPANGWLAREAEGRHRCPRSAQAGTTTASHLGLPPQLRTFLLDLDRDAEQAQRLEASE